MEVGKLTSKGQTTIPKKIRDRLGLKSGDRLMFSIENGQIVIRPKTGSIRDAIGMFHDPNRKPVTVEEMNKAVGDAIVERYMRSLPAKARKGRK